VGKRKEKYVIPLGNRPELIVHRHVSRQGFAGQKSRGGLRTEIKQPSPRPGFSQGENGLQQKAGEPRLPAKGPRVNKGSRGSQVGSPNLQRGWGQKGGREETAKKKKITMGRADSKNRAGRIIRRVGLKVETSVRRAIEKRQMYVRNNSTLFRKI